MTVTDHNTRPPAWHRDPSGRHELRWWDGEAWTDRVRDGDAVGTDPPVPTDVVESVESAPSTDTTTGQEADGADGGDFAGLGARNQVLPPELRPTTAPGATAEGLDRRRLIGLGAVAAVVLLSLLWGWHNWTSANEWRDRAGVVQERLDDRESNYAALERSLGNAASRGAQALDSQQVMVEMGDSVDMVVNQLHSCAATLDDMIAMIGTADVQTLARRAADACGAAVHNAEVLGGLVDDLTGGS